MEFGRITSKELNKLDLSLPKDPSGNTRYLRGKPHKKTSFHLGCAKWGRPEWVGKLYPKGTREKDFLQQYVGHYNAIELNATHYKLYNSTVTSGWADAAAGRQFLFCPKMYKGISHFGNLSTKMKMTVDYLKGVEGFGPHLGPVFIQVSDRFSPKRIDELQQYLSMLPAGHQYFIEVRHPDWFNTSAGEQLFTHLDKLKMGAMITDTAGRRDCLHMRLTCRKTFIRFVGNSLHKTDYTRCDDWIKRLKEWFSAGLQEAFFFMHMHDEAKSPELSQYFATEVNKHLKMGVPEPIPGWRKKG